MWVEGLSYPFYKGVQKVPECINISFNDSKYMTLFLVCLHKILFAVHNLFVSKTTSPTLFVKRSSTYSYEKTFHVTHRCEDLLKAKISGAVCWILRQSMKMAIAQSSPTVRLWQNNVFNTIHVTQVCYTIGFLSHRHLKLRVENKFKADHVVVPKPVHQKSFFSEP